MDSETEQFLTENLGPEWVKILKVTEESNNDKSRKFPEKSRAACPHKSKQQRIQTKAFNYS